MPDFFHSLLIMQQLSPLFSIIIPTYNRAHLLPIAIQSVLDQTVTDWELIVVDDGSTDETKAVVQSFAHEQIKYIYQENGKISKARNKGIQHAQGLYLCFLDDDDYFLSKHLFYLKEKINSTNQPVAVFRSGVLQKIGGRLNEYPNYDANSNLTPVQFVWYQPVNLLSIAIHHSICKRFNFNEAYKQFEDIHFLIQVLLLYPFIQIKQYTAIYVNHSQMGSFVYYENDDVPEKELNWLNNLFDLHDNSLKEHISQTMLQEGITFHYLNRANKALFSRHFQKGIQFFWNALTTKVSWKTGKSYLYTFALFWSKLIFNYPKVKKT